MEIPTIFQDVKIGYSDANQLSVDLDESLSGIYQQQSSSSLLSGSPPSGRTSPPMPLTPIITSNPEPLELQIDYWPIAKSGDREKNQTKSTDQGKISIKSTFRNLQVNSFFSNVSPFFQLFGLYFRFIDFHCIHSQAMCHMV